MPFVPPDVTPPPTPFGGMMGSTAYTEKEQGIDFGIKQQYDPGTYVWDTLQGLSKFGIDFYQNMKTLEFKRKFHEAENAKKKAEEVEKTQRQQHAIRSMLKAMKALGGRNIPTIDWLGPLGYTFGSHNYGGTAE